MNATRTLSALTVLACALVAPAASQSMTAAPAPSDAETIQARTLRVGDRDRTVAYYVPAGSRHEAALLIVLHGSQMTGATMRRATAQRFDRLADREGFVVAYPDALDRIWADCRPQSAWRSGVDDVGFLRDVVRTAAAEFDVDAKRVYLFGYSGGGYMAYRYAAASKDEVRAIAVVAANMQAAPDTQRCESGADARVLLISGTADRINPYAGGRQMTGATVLSADDTAALLAKRLGLGDPSTRGRLPTVNADDPTRALWQSWDARGTPMVALITIDGGGHTVPQPSYTFPADLGATSSFDAPAAAWAFFTAR